LDCPAAPSGETRGVRIFRPPFFGRHRGSDEGGGSSDPQGPNDRRGHLPPGMGPSRAVSRTRPRGGARSLPVPRGAHPCGARPVGPAGLGWGLGPPSRRPRPGGAGSGGSPDEASGRGHRPDLPPNGAALGGRALARPPFAAPRRRPWGPHVQEKRFGVV